MLHLFCHYNTCLVHEYRKRAIARVIKTQYLCTQISINSKNMNKKVFLLQIIFLGGSVVVQAQETIEPDDAVTTRHLVSLFSARYLKMEPQSNIEN